MSVADDRIAKRPGLRSSAGRRYRVLHLITRLELGGAQQNTLFCVARHDRERFEVELLSGAGGILDEDARRIPDARVELLPFLVHPVSPRRDLVAMLRLRNHFKARGIDLVHTHSSKAGIVGRLAARAAGVPVVVHTVHGWSFHPLQPAWLRQFYVTLERVAASLSDRLIVVARSNREKGLDAGIGRPDRYVVIRSGIDAERFRRPAVDRAAVRKSLGLGASHTVVGTIACLKPQKAPLDFVRAAAAAHAADPRFRFVIAGDGELRPKVEEEIDRLGLREVVQLLGWRTDVPDLLHAMDVFLLTSIHEGLPRSVLQAMAAGVPVVATAVDGTPEVVEHGLTGFLVPPSRPDLAARRLIELTGNEELRRDCARRAADRLVGSFDIHRMVRELDELYLSLLADGDR